MHSIKNLSPSQYQKELDMDEDYGEKKIIPDKFRGEQISII